MSKQRTTQAIGGQPQVTYVAHGRRLNW